MRGRTVEEIAVLVVDPERRFVDASPGALDLFGVDLLTLRTKRVGDFTMPPEREAVVAAFETMVASGAEGFVGEADIVRPDGTALRIRFTTAPHPDRPGHYKTILRSLGPPADRIEIRTVAQVLADWRAAERDLARVTAGSPEHAEASDRLDTLRAEYQEVTGRHPRAR